MHFPLALPFAVPAAAAADADPADGDVAAGERAQPGSGR